jgi:hypothetical protein
MPISNEEWASIARMIELEIGNRIGRRRDFFLFSKVAKRDPIKNLIWVKELQDTPIPIMSFDYDVIYYDESPKGVERGYRTYKKHAEVKVKCPLVGEIVLIAREMGSDFIPRCLGVLRSTDYIGDMED